METSICNVIYLFVLDDIIVEIEVLLVASFHIVANEHFIL